MLDLPITRSVRRAGGFVQTALAETAGFRLNRAVTANPTYRYKTERNTAICLE